MRKSKRVTKSYNLLLGLKLWLVITCYFFSYFLFFARTIQIIWLFSLASAWTRTNNASKILRITSLSQEWSVRIYNIPTLHYSPDILHHLFVCMSKVYCINGICFKIEKIQKLRSSGLSQSFEKSCSSFFPRHMNAKSPRIMAGWKSKKMDFYQSGSHGCSQK